MATEKKNEVEYEHGAVEFETPQRELATAVETPKRSKKKASTGGGAPLLEHDCGCWCGAPRRIRARCDGHPTRVHTLPGGTLNFICPAGNGITSPPKAIVQAAERAGLKNSKSKEKKPNG